MTGATAGGTLNNWLAVVGVISLMYWAWRAVSALQHRAAVAQALRGAQAVAASTLGAPDPDAPASYPEDLAVIAAAVHAMLGRTSLLHLEPTGAGQAWAGEGRWMQQTSHTPGPATVPRT